MNKLMHTHRCVSAAFLPVMFTALVSNRALHSVAEHDNTVLFKARTHSSLFAERGGRGFSAAVVSEGCAQVLSHMGVTLLWCNILSADVKQASAEATARLLPSFGPV